MALHDHFSHIYCLNLERRKDRRQSAEAQFEKWGIEGVEFFPAIDGKDIKGSFDTTLNAGELGIVLSNIAILHDANRKGYETILILEDDCIFSEEIKNIDAYFESLPSDFHSVYISGNHNTHNTTVENRPPYPVNDRIVKMHNTYSTHAVGIKNTMYDVILDELCKLSTQLDVSYTFLQRKYNWYCLKSATGEAVATQMESYSDITGKVENYNWLIK